VKTSLLRPALYFVAAFLAISGRAKADPNAYDYAVPPTIHHINATARTLSANLDVLKEISTDFADAYRIKEGTYSFDAPDRLEYRVHIGLLSVTYTTTDSERIVSGSIFHTSTDISHDVTKRNTLQVLGLLPKDYLDTMRIDYVGPDVVNGIPVQAFMLRYITDSPTANRRFEMWVDPVKHYIVQKRVWNGPGFQRETIMYKNPEQVKPGFWMPTIAEAYTPSMQLAGVVGYENITAD
jgi:hypothetical protein